MFNKKSIKIISMVLLVIMLLVTMGSSVMAVTMPSPNDNVDVSALDGIVGTILGFIKWGGLAVAVGMAMFLGIKYITSSPDGKAEIKKTMTFYILGIVLLLAATTIVSFIQTTITGSGTTSTTATSLIVQKV